MLIVGLREKKRKIFRGRYFGVIVAVFAFGLSSLCGGCVEMGFHAVSLLINGETIDEINSYVFHAI